MTLKEIYHAAGDEGRYEIRRFMRDMRRAGLRMRPYNGRNFYHGPAVAVDGIYSFGHATQATCVPLQHDSLALGFIVYPRQSLAVAV